MKPKNFPGRKYRRQIRANMKVWGMLGVPITWEMRTQAYSHHFVDINVRVGAKNRDERGHVLRHPGNSIRGYRADFIVHDDAMGAVRYSYAAMKADIEAYRIMFPSTAQLWKHPNVTP